jgi:hypothetical protein
MAGSWLGESIAAAAQYWRDLLIKNTIKKQLVLGTF